MATLAQLEEGVRRAYTAGKMDYARILGAELVRARGDRVNQIPGMAIAPPPSPEPTLAEEAIGLGEGLLSTVTAIPGAAAGFAAGTAKGLTESILSGEFGTPEAARAVEEAAIETSIKGAGHTTYVPRTREGTAWTEAIAEAASAIPPVLPVVPGLAAASAGAGSQIAQGAKHAAAGAKTAAKTVGETVDRIIPEAIKNKPKAGGSVGAAAVDMETLRREKAAGLPVPVNLTKGAATRNADDLSFEKEAMKGPQGEPLRARAEENNLQALQNFDNLIDASGAQAVRSGPAAVGNRVIDALSEGWQQAKNKTRAAYTEARKSPEAQERVDLDRAVTVGRGDSQLTDSVIGYLNKQPSDLPATGVPDAAKQFAVSLELATVDKGGKLVPNKNVTVLQVEDWRQAVGDAIGHDPRDRRQGAILKSLIDQATGNAGGQPFARARALRRQQARKYENRAVVYRLITDKRGTEDPKVTADKVFRAAILNGSPEEVTFLRRVMSTTQAGKDAWKEMEGATIDWIKSEATKGMGMDSGDNALVSPARLHAAVSQLDSDGRLDILLGKKKAQVVRDLNEIVRYVSTVPPGTLVNPSGTAGMLMAAIAEAGATGAVTGLPVPVLSALRLIGKGINNAKLKARIKRALGE